MLALPALGVAGAGAARGLGFSLELPDFRSALVFLVVAPVLEEYVFRAWLQQALAERWQGPRRALLAATVLFAVCHAPWMGWQALWLLAPGLTLGYLWWMHRSLWLNIAAHASFNGALALVTPGA